MIEKSPVCTDFSRFRLGIYSLDHLKMLQCLHNRILFFLRTLRLLCILVFRFMVILPLDDAVLLLHLCDIEIGHLELMVFPHIIPNLVVSRLAFRSSHIQFIHADVHFDVTLDIEFGQKENRLKVGLDCANGSSWNIAKSVFDALGADTYVINNQPNGLNINLNAGSTHIEGLQKFVVEKGLDVGFAYDGDADRCLCVDEKGNVITGDHILYIYGCYMKERGKLLTNTVVTTVMSNFGLYKAFDEKGIGYAKTAVGDKYVYEYMAKNGCRIGGEQSGHIIFSKYASTGDGILTSLKMMEVMLAKKKPMSELAAPLKIYPQVLENVRVSDKKAAQNDPAVQEAVSKVAETLGDTGRILVRESGTEPLVRVMVEAPDHDTCQKYVDEVVKVICEKGYKA